MNRFKGHRSFLLSLLFIIAVEITVTVIVYNEFLDQERSDKKDLLDRTNTTLFDNINTNSKNFVHDLSKKAGTFRQIKRYLTPNEFRDIIRNDLSIINVQSQRWIPYINDTVRTEFEDFYNDIYGNFTIRDINFEDGVFNIADAPTRPFYYPFALSEPPFTLAPMGGDFYTNSQAFLTILNAPTQPSFSTRLRLARANSATDYGIYLQYFVKCAVGTPIGAIQNLVVFSEIVDSIIERQQFDRKSLELFIYDDRIIDSVVDLEDALIYREPTSNVISTYQELQSITEDFHVYTIREYPLLYVFRYKESYTDTVVSDLPIVILISFIIMSFLIDIVVVTGYIFYNYRLEAMKNLTYKEMLNFINHELRNPLNAMIGSIAFLIRKLKVSDVSNSYLMDKLILCESQCNLMVYIIDRVKGMKMLIEGKQVSELTAFQNTQFSLEQLVIMVNTIIQSKIEENGYVEYDTEYVCDKDALLIADKNRLTEVLLNVLDNAVKYSKPNTPGTIKLVIDKKDNNIIFQIKDSGIGIDNNVKDKLFKPYSRANTAKDVSGSGLGLYYCKLICEKMNGNITYDSTYNTGTVFTITIPHTVNTDIDDTDDDYSVLDLDLDLDLDLNSEAQSSIV